MKLFRTFKPLGDAVLEYVQLAFNQDYYLVGLSGIPDFKLTLWNWKRGEKIHSVETQLGVRQCDKNMRRKK